MDSTEDKILKAKRIVERASKVVVLSGAGVSAESGVPTFRGDGGLWRNFRAEDLATPDAFYRDPKLVWEWYDWRRTLMKAAKPNPGHFAVVDLEREKSKFTLITQNIDGLHRLAGSRNVIEMHGNIWQTRCTNCTQSDENYDVPIKEIPPVCRACGAVMRPNIVWYGEMIPMAVIDKALFAMEDCDVMLIIGTSGVVQPAASMGIVAKQSGKTVIEINTEPTINSQLYDMTVIGKSGEILPALCKSPQTAN
ncbi:MAG: SIR2 family NAD-dependent protein deacylase [Deltaproteobacteria bacterium]